MSLRIPIIITLALVLAPSLASGETDDACYLHARLSTTRMLRRTALAVLGRVPTVDEYKAVEALSSDDPAVESMIDGWLESDEYRLQMRRYHLALLWTNPRGVTINDTGMTLTRRNIAAQGDPAVFVWRMNGRMNTYRGGDGQQMCKDVPQSAIGYDSNGLPICEPSSNGCQEGWVEVAPYVDPSITLRVCAFDAQANETYVKTDNPNPGTYSCGNFLARNRKECGCGPDLRYCLFGSPYSVNDTILSAMQEQLLLLVDDYTSGAAPYRELITTDRAYSNGLLDFYFAYVAPSGSLNRLYNSPHAEDWPLEPDWLDTSFREVTRSAPHAGVITLPAYNLRFQTNRGRANRFRIAFLGQYFLPPGDEETPGCSWDAADLTKRCVCLGCHQTLEPLASYFGSFSEAGAGLLTSFDAQTDTQTDCRNQIPPGAAGVCSRFYSQITVEDPDNPGQTMDVWRLKPLEFADDHPEYQQHFDTGPAGLVADEAMKPLQGKEYSYLAWSTVRSLFSFLMHRELDLDPLSGMNEQALLDTLATEFEASDFDFKTLVRRVVTLPAFRRMP